MSYLTVDQMCGYGPSSRDTEADIAAIHTAFFNKITAMFDILEVLHNA